MARSKRKRDVVPDDPAPTPRRRRSQAGHEPTTLKSTPESAKPKLSNSQEIDPPKVDTAKAIETKSSKIDVAFENAPSQPARAAKSPTSHSSDFGDDHAENEEKKTTSQAESVMEFSSSTKQEVVSIPASAVLSKARTASPPIEKSSKSTRRTTAQNPDQTSTDADHVNSSLTVPDEEATRREARIRAALKNRKLLLHRVQQGKDAAQKRIDAIHRDHPEKKEITDEQEAAAFQEMVRTVTAAVRKQARGDAANSANEQRSVSLRRGNTVGKRMNAAISTLTGGLDDQQQYTGMDAGTIAAFGSQVESSTVPSVAVVKAATTETVKHAIAVNGATHKATVRPSSASGHGPSQRKGNHDPLGASVKQKSYSVATGVSQPNANATNGGVARKALQQQQFHHVPRVICPETSALRDRRDEIRIQLAKMLQDRHHRSELAAATLGDTLHKPHERRTSLLSIPPSPPSGRSSLLGHRETPTIANGKPTPHRAASHLPLWQGPDPAPMLPQRRKTHWDTVLQEMRWMATDFIEERKWKASTAKLLGALVSKAADKEDPNTANMAGDDAMDIAEPLGNNISASVEQIAMTSTHEQAAVSSKQSSVEVTSINRLLFSEISEEDILASREVAKLLCGQISDFTQSEKQPRVPRSSVHDDDQPSMSDPSALSNSHEPVVLENGPFDKVKFIERASNHIDSILKALDGALTPSNSSKTTAQEYGLRLLSDQADVVAAVEDLWMRVRVGAVLHGPVASGKTASACSLLWRHRARGPQLLICSTSSTVSRAWLA
jgi:HSA